jgi:orotidine-5'-phosphate decarboxylase
MAIIGLLANGALQQMVQPIAFGATLGLHPLAVLILTIAGGSLFGMIGLVLAAPIASAIVRITGKLAQARAAAEAAADGAGERPRLLAVTVLTSLDRGALQRELKVPVAVEGHVVHLAALAREAGCDGAVASPQEARALRASLGPTWLIVTPGVRPAAAGAGDQARIATPAAARRAGADCVVIGRPITEAPDPARAAEAILQELGG